MVHGVLSRHTEVLNKLLLAEGQLKVLVDTCLGLTLVLKSELCHLSRQEGPGSGLRLEMAVLGVDGHGELEAITVLEVRHLLSVQNLFAGRPHLTAMWLSYSFCALCRRAGTPHHRLRV